MQLNEVSLRGRARWHLTVACVVSAWLGITAVFLVSYRLGLPVVWWDIIHSFTLGALSTAIVAYSTHFTEALTRTQASSYFQVALRIALIQIGLIGLLVDRAGFDWGWLADVSAGIVLIAAVWHIWFISHKLRGSLAGSFAVTVPFYIAATVFLAIAIVFAILAGNGAGDYSDLIAAHSRATIWGFAWLTVLGTIVTLLPTLSKTTISVTARTRCTRALLVHCTGLLVAVSALALGNYPLAGFALLFVSLAAVLIIQPVTTGALGPSNAPRPAINTAAWSVIAGLLWLVALSTTDAVLLISSIFPRQITLWAVPAMLGAGLAQMVLGVLHFLLPTLIGGGPAKVNQARDETNAGGLARLLLINLGALLTLMPAQTPNYALTSGLILLALGLIGHVCSLLFVARKQYRLEKP